MLTWLQHLALQPAEFSPFERSRAGSALRGQLGTVVPGAGMYAAALWPVRNSHSCLHRRWGNAQLTFVSEEAGCSSCGLPSDRRRPWPS
jgi:hypothetical protein